jgi:hypothetical protein
MHTPQLRLCVFRCTILLLWLNLLASADAATSTHYFGAENQSPSFNAPADRCPVKVSWQLLATERRHNLRTSWYSFGDLWQKWRWKVVVHNPREKPMALAIELTLKSVEGFTLDRVLIGGGVSDVFGPLKAWIPAYGTETFQGTSQYNTSAHDGEGKPRKLDWRVFCDVQ